MLRLCPSAARSRGQLIGCMKRFFGVGVNSHWRTTPPPRDSYISIFVAVARFNMLAALFLHVSYSTIPQGNAEVLQKAFLQLQQHS